jgi:hypothetical protein
VLQGVSADPVAADSGSKKKCPDVLVALEDLLRDSVAGDPMSGMRWTHKSIRKLCAALRKRGLPVHAPMCHAGSIGTNRF